jgi:outer membrane protein OmpA-like peptidoglycan-associated protein
VKTYYDPRRGRPGHDRRLTKNGKILVGALAVLVLLIGLMIILGEPAAPDTTRLVWISEKTTRAPGVMPDVVKKRVRDLGVQGGGQLVTYAVGNRAELVDTANLDIRQDGDRVSDPGQLAAAVGRKLSSVAKKMADAPVGGRGFSLYQALRVAADEAARTGEGESVEVWLSTTVLSGSADPLSIPTLTENETDPGQAVDELLKGSLHELDLRTVDLHVVLLDPVGDNQEQLNPRTETWRNAFIKRLGEKLGAQMSDPVHDNSSTRAWPRASDVPPIVPMVEKTPVQPRPQPPAAGPPEAPRIDNAAFEPDKASLVNPDAVRQVVAQVVQAYKDNPGRFRVQIVGYCAKFGSAEGAVRLSTERARTISALLQQEGVLEADTDALGVGFNELADETQPPQSPAQRVVVIRLVART